MTKSKLMETFKEMSDNAYRIAQTFKESGNVEMYRIFMAEERAFMTAFEMINDDKYAKKIREIFFVD